MGLEFQLNALVARLAPLSEVVSAARAAMEKLAAQDEYLGPPYTYYTITAAGIMQV